MSEARQPQSDGGLKVKAVSLDKLYHPWQTLVVGRKLDHYRRVINLPHLCPRCWLLRLYCCCEKLKDVSKSLGNIVDVVVYTHPSELLQRRGTNTGKHIMIQGGHCVIQCHHPHEEWLVQQIVACPKRAAIVFPAPEAIYVPEYLHRLGITTQGLAKEAEKGREDDRYVDPMRSVPNYLDAPLPQLNPSPQRPLIIFLDTTWSSAPSMAKRIDMLIYAHGYRQSGRTLHNVPKMVTFAPTTSSESIIKGEHKVEDGPKNSTVTTKEAAPIASDAISVIRLRLNLNAWNTMGRLRGLGKPDDPNTANRLNTMQAFAALVEELLGLPSLAPDASLLSLTEEEEKAGNDGDAQKVSDQEAHCPGNDVTNNQCKNKNDVKDITPQKRTASIANPSEENGPCQDQHHASTSATLSSSSSSSVSPPSLAPIMKPQDETLRPIKRPRLNIGEG